MEGGLGLLLVKGTATAAGAIMIIRAASIKGVNQCAGATFLHRW